MNRRDFVSIGVSAVVANSLGGGHHLLAAENSPKREQTNSQAKAEWTLANESIRLSLEDNGTIRTLEVNGAGQWEGVPFRKGVLSGPAWAGVGLQRDRGSKTRFARAVNGISYSLSYRIDGDRLAVVASLANQSPDPFTPQAARLVLGINSEMSSYPSWDYRYFPTLLRCEKTHFWGYFMTPKGRIMTIGSPDPVASYSFNYDESVWVSGDGGGPTHVRGEGDHNPDGSSDGGHIIYTASLDLLHALPLPPRHPQDLAAVEPGESRSWTIYFQPVSAIEQIKPVLAASLSAPMIGADRYTLAANESSNLTIWADTRIDAAVTDPTGLSTPLDVKPLPEGNFAIAFRPASGTGQYRITVVQKNGHRSEAIISIRHPWSWYMSQARRESLVNKQYASSHLEQWLGLETDVLARRYLPDADLDAQTDKRLKEILNLQWDLESKTPSNIPHKYRLFANTAQMAGVLAYRYMADGDTYWLDLASGFADYTVSRQDLNGAFDIYTAIFYPVKSIMTVMAAERMAASDNSRFKLAYNRHYESARKAIDFLVHAQDNLTTEGQNTFEDGMISCAATQIGLFALLQKDEGKRLHYAEASRRMLISHRCLEQLLIPDSRMNGATLRFWEAQYDVLIGESRNMMVSPHGWSAWLIPGLWFQYLLTGEEAWLQMTMNALGSCAQLIDSKTGQLRWAFVVDPYRSVNMLEPDQENASRGKRVQRIIGEQYVPMIASFHYPDHEPISGNGWDSGWTACNDVNEVFVALAEVALTSAYVIERTNGELATWNCTANQDNDGVIEIHVSEDVVNRVHLNLNRHHSIKAIFGKVPELFVRAEGMQWIGPGGVPELIRERQI